MRLRIGGEWPQAGQRSEALYTSLPLRDERHAMIVGAALIEIHVHGSRSLKQKRGVVRAISQRLRNRFNLAVAEVGGQGSWQRAQLGLTAVGGETGVVRAVLERALDFVESLHLAEILASEVEIVNLPHQGSNDMGSWEETWPVDEE